MNGTVNTSSSAAAICEPDAEFCTFAEHNHQTDPRQVAWQLVINGVAGGLPIPHATDIPGHYDIFLIKLPNNDRAGVDAWAEYLGLPEAKLGDLMQGHEDDEFRTYQAETYRFPALPGWTVYVRCFVREQVTQ